MLHQFVHQNRPDQKSRPICRSASEFVKVVRLRQSLKAVCAVGTRTWWLDWLEHDSEGEVRESGAAFGCLAELATRRGSPLRPVPLQEVPSSTSSLPRRLDVPAESCQPPSSRPTRTSGSSPTVHTAAALRCGRRCCTSTPPSCSRSRYRRRRLRWMPPPPQGWRYPTHPQPASHAASALAAASAAGAARCLPEDGTTPDSIHVLLATLEET